MISYTDFARMLTAASECSSYDVYVTEVGGSVPLDDVDNVIRLLTAIWTMARDGLTIKSIAQACDISMLEISRELGISRRTIGDWSTGDRNPPEWQLPLIAYAVLQLYE